MPMQKRTAIATAAAFLLGTAVGALAWFGAGWAERVGIATTTAQPVWSEVAWPFPLDQSGKGKAFRCKAANCGTEVNVYIRAKIGFCNCTTGVTDDDELERISDFDLVGNRLSAQGPGRPISVAGMKGRSRSYTIGGVQRAGKSALSVGFNDRCDTIVATAVINRNRPDASELAVLEFLNSRTIRRWAEVTLGL
jgi:hypothetical protein